MPLSVGVISLLTSLCHVELHAFSKVARFQDTQLKCSAGGRQGPIIKTRASTRLLTVRGDTVKKVTEFYIRRLKTGLNL